MKVYIVCGTTESGDDYRIVYQSRPTRAQFLADLAFAMPDEFGEGFAAEGQDEDTWTINAPREAEEVTVQDGR